MSIGVRLIKITVIFAFIHVVIFGFVFLFQDSFELGKLNDLVLGGSVYVPLLFWDMMGINVFQSNGAMLSSPSTIGWLLCMITWLTIYISISYLIIVISRIR
jgi:hypothetical protein